LQQLLLLLVCSAVFCITALWLSSLLETSHACAWSPCPRA